MTREDAEYLAVLCDMRVMDLESQARKQAADGYSMESVKSLIEASEWAKRLKGRLIGYVATAAHAASQLDKYRRMVEAMPPSIQDDIIDFMTGEASHG